MVVNDAILQLTGYRLPDLVQTVFAAQPIATIFSDNRQNVTLVTQKPVAEKGFGYGGGFLAGAAGTRVRANFLPLAYYGVLPTDASGKAHADFTMPDDLTTWRVMAVALGPGQRFATADNTFVANQPLILNALLPQFARPGDRFDLAHIGRARARQPAPRGTIERRDHRQGHTRKKGETGVAQSAGLAAMLARMLRRAAIADVDKGYGRKLSRHRVLFCTTGAAPNILLCSIYHVALPRFKAGNFMTP